MPVPKGHLWRTIPQREAGCDNCDWEAYSRNAMGLAAQHHIKTGHIVRVATTVVHVYESLESQARWRKK